MVKGKVIYYRMNDRIRKSPFCISLYYCFRKDLQSMLKLIGASLMRDMRFIVSKHLSKILTNLISKGKIVTS